MPFKLRKKPNHDLYWVVNETTGKKYSKQAIPKKDAKAQMRILISYTTENDVPFEEKKGKKGKKRGMEKTTSRSL